MNNARTILTTKEVANICNTTCKTVSRWCDSGKLLHYKIPGTMQKRIVLENLIKFCKEHKIEANIEPFKNKDKAFTYLQVLQSKQKLEDDNDFYNRLCEVADRVAFFNVHGEPTINGSTNNWTEFSLCDGDPTKISAKWEDYYCGGTDYGHANIDPEFIWNEFALIEYEEEQKQKHEEKEQQRLEEERTEQKRKQKEDEEYAEFLDWKKNKQKEELDA